MEINNQLSFLTVTYERDFDLLERLLNSIKLHVGTTYKHYIVLNDSIDHLAELEEIIRKFPMQIEIILRDQFQDFQLPLLENSPFGHRFTQTDEGWATQIMLTMLSAIEIKTPFYLHLCSKDVFGGPFDINNVIKDGKTVVWNENFNHGGNTNQFIDYAINACKFLNLNFEQNKQFFIRPSTPGALNTQQMKNILDYLKEQNISVVDLIGFNTGSFIDGVFQPSQNKTIEYYLYSAWLIKTQLVEETVIWHNSAIHNTLYNINMSYDLRRKN